MAGRTVTETAEAPGALGNMLRAVAGALPFVPRGDTVPSRTLRLTGVPVDRRHVAAYAAVTGLRFGDTVPLTYPFVFTFPLVMSLVTGRDFPFAAMGSVHTENSITALAPIAVSDTVDVTVHADNLREHRRGLLVDLVSEISVGRDAVWRQVTTFLHQQRTSLSDEPRPARTTVRRRPPPPQAVLRVTPAQIRRYAAISGDYNPIHTSGLGAKLFGFPTAIAHGMFGAAAALANVEGQLPDAVRYDVRFGKPILLPAQVGLYVEHTDDRWDLVVRNLSKGDPHITGTLTPL